MAGLIDYSSDSVDSLVYTGVSVISIELLGSEPTGMGSAILLKCYTFKV